MSKLLTKKKENILIILGEFFPDSQVIPEKNFISTIRKSCRKCG